MLSKGAAILIAVVLAAILAVGITGEEAGGVEDAVQK